MFVHRNNLNDEDGQTIFDQLEFTEHCTLIKCPLAYLGVVSPVLVQSKSCN